jgi:P27 family predicted phage terminase small subunit
MPNYRKPESKKRVSGTFRRDRAKKAPSGEALASVPPAPDHLSPVARKEWQRLAPHLVKQGTMARADLRAFELLSEVLATSAQAQAVIAEQGLTIGTDGSVRAHPAIKILEQARAQAIRLLGEFGLTPRARGHVEPAPPPAAKNPFSEI